MSLRRKQKIWRRWFENFAPPRRLATWFTVVFGLRREEQERAAVLASKMGECGSAREGSKIE
ncbi:hypothetical protein TSUD_244910 [Trifolium subterraneum]|uniref:Uncharacterized protein n=1 Tax=Trifolium subterraneum TaxID=3900 RepID=A0A2Z6NCJ7_TRISU|nr:hypothetical protein TSUD_244910 [Trifolium subterraneum]